MIEHVVIDPFNFIQDAAVQPQRRPHRPARIGGQPTDSGFGAGKPIASPLQLEAHQRTPGVVEGSSHQLLLGITEPLEIFLGQIDTTTAPVFPHIPKDVGELVGDPQGDGSIGGVRTVAPGS